MTERSLSSAPHDLTNSSCAIPDRLSLCVAVFRSKLHLVGYLAERRGLACTWCRQGVVGCDGDACEAGLTCRVDQVLQRSLYC